MIAVFSLLMFLFTFDDKHIHDCIAVLCGLVLWGLIGPTWSMFLFSSWLHCFSDFSNLVWVFISIYVGTLTDVKTTNQNWVGSAQFK